MNGPDLYTGCPCYACDKPAQALGTITLTVRMPLCPTCGIKRCPGARDHTDHDRAVEVRGD